MNKQTPNHHTENPLENNPYAAPKAVLTKTTEPSDTILLDEPDKRPASAGWDWFRNAWVIFKDAPMLWIGMVIVYWIIYAVGSNIPILNIIIPFMSCIFIGGIMLGCHAVANDEPLSFDYLFAGFRGNWVDLLLVGILSSILTVLAMLPGLLIMGSSLLPLFMGSADVSSVFSNISFVTMGIGAVVVFLGVILASMTYWFAPALITIHEFKAIDAMKLSFKGCVRNIIPFILYWLIGVLLVIIAAIPLLLGFIILLPVFMISYYTSYRDVLTQVD